jgi:shikimate kinase / 3-dehydroquinate synthase
MAPVLALSGFMGSGKSSVGPRVAEILEWEYVDLDDAFVAAEGMPIAEYFAAKGEAAFRARECDLLEELLSSRASVTGLVVALGGGTLESPWAIRLLHDKARVVYLDVAADVAWARSQGTGRPLATDEERFRTLLARRRAQYEHAADWVLPVEGRGPEQLAQEIAGFVQLGGSRWADLWGRRLKATQRSSTVVGGVGALATLGHRAGEVLRLNRHIFVLTDRNVSAAWGERIAALLGVSTEDAVLALEPGEASKNLNTLGYCWDWLAEKKARRDDVVVAVGGGVVGDLAGFAAATYQRGVELWQVPTSLLAQVDSSIGGKTAIDLASGKNLVGAFYQPDLVVVDPETLTTLSEADFVCGLGEVVKHALLTSASALEDLENNVQAIADRDLAVVGKVVKESVFFKSRVVQQDEREHGVRAVLNLGHTMGHAIEVVLGYGAISHGGAVALGLLVALGVSEDVLGLDPDVRIRTKRLLTALGLPTSWSLPASDVLIAATARDKKARAGTLGFVGLRAPGEAVWGLNITPGTLATALEVIRN